MSSHLIFIGTYTRTNSRGVYAVRLDGSSGNLSEPVVAAETTSPTFLALSPDKKKLYAVRDTQDMAAGFAVGESGRLTPLASAPSAKAIPPCHLAVDRSGRALVLANYHAAIVAALPLAGDGTVGEPRVVHHAGHGADPKRQASAHPHCVVFSPDHRFVVSCDLGLDRIFSYRLDPARAELSPADPPFVAVKPGAGPRHFVFAAGGRRGYAITELSSTIVAYDYDSETGSLSTRETVSTLPAGFAGESIAAEICLHPNGRFLYASNRGHDSLAVFAIDAVSGALSPVEIVPCGGKGPRNFSLSPDGAWLVCAHQESNSLCSFRVDSATGRLARVEGGVSIPTPVCVLFYD